MFSGGAYGEETQQFNISDIKALAKLDDL